ncbi:MAG: branched-chain amino acid transport system II carrier protein [Lachnospiraceae bacterium]|nr:branched-chain amino acid transport system II carrier protein [Lachnospiraceae bacterium]
MKKSLTLKESIIVGSMLFGMFFGAGNLIFPVHMGQLAGANVWPAIIGFILTGVGIPLLGVACLGISKKDSLFDLAGLVGDKYRYFLTIVLYLTIGPFFAIPRCASTSFTIGMLPLINGSETVPRLIFTFVFFAIVLFFSLRPSGIMKWVGQYINPIFLIFLVILIVVAFINPLGDITSYAGDAAYGNGNAFFKGFLEGYGTMDAIASLAFGITVIRVVRDLGIKNETDVAVNTIKAGAIGCAVMAVIYALTTLMGTMSLGKFEVSSNGGVALSEITQHYFGRFGIYFLLATVTLACLKTALSLVISCSEMFHTMFPNFISEKTWAIIFTVFSFVVSNFGLDAIITWAVPVLMFLYPLTISIILLALFGRFFNYDKKVFVVATIFNMVAAAFDLIGALPVGIVPEDFVTTAQMFGNRFFPFYSLGLGWIVPTIIGVVFGLVWSSASKRKV